MKEGIYSTDELFPMEEVLPIVTELAAEWGGNEHTSITYEKAQELMEAVLYCIRQTDGGSGPAAEGRKIMTDRATAREVYLLGRRITADKVKELQELYNELILDFQDYGLACLGDTIKKGIPAFLLKYDIKYAPQETILTLDYPVLRDLSDMTGVNAVLEYVGCINLEQQFLKRFDEKYICTVLRAYYRDYEYLAENISSIVLQSIMGHMMLNKPLYYEGFTEKEYENLGKCLSGKSHGELKSLIDNMLKNLIDREYGYNKEMFRYLSVETDNIAVRFENNLLNHCLDKMFLM